MESPTNDAPVTVEEQDVTFANQIIAKFRQIAKNEWFADGHAGHWLAKDIARHRLAALASAPAGDAYGAVVPIDGKRPDWVRGNDRLLMRRKATGQWRGRSWYGFNWGDFDAIRALADHPHYAVAPAGDGVEAELRNALAVAKRAIVQAAKDTMWCDDSPAETVVDRIDAALACPRAAVGERSLAEAITAMWQDNELWGDSATVTRIAGDFSKLMDKVRALQSPPAKVEDE